MNSWERASSRWREDGIVGVARAVGERLTDPFHRYGRRIARWWRKEDHWFVGKWVEISGNLVMIDGCRFTVAHPSIPCRLKSRFYLGLYEAPERQAIAQFLDPDLPVVELGGGIGVVSCIANRQLRDPRKHVVLEANPHLLGQIERNRSMNECTFRIEHKALSYAGEQVEFSIEEIYLASGLHGAGCSKVKVPATSLAQVLDEHGYDEATLICDVEGAEHDLVRNESSVLRRRVPLAIVEAHDVNGLGTRQGFRHTMECTGFACLSEAAGTYVFRRLK